MEAARASSPAGGALIVVDASTSGGAQALVFAMARAAVKTRGRRRVTVLLHASADAHLDLPTHVQVVASASAGAPDELEAMHRWVLDASSVIVSEGAGLFPRLLGVSLGELNVLAVQNALADFAVVATAAAAMLRDGQFRECHVIGADAERAASLRAIAAQLGVNNSSWVVPFASPLRFLQRLVRHRRNPAAIDIAKGWRELAATHSMHAQTLMLAETVPMTRMFEVVEPHLASRSGPVTRIQLEAGADEVQQRAGVTSVSLSRPRVGPPTKHGRFKACWPQAKKKLQALRSSARLGTIDVPIPATTVLEFLYFELFDQQFDHLHFARRVLDDASPSIVVVGNDRWWIAVAFILLARADGIPTVCVQDGLTADIAFWRWITADVFCASGPETAEMLGRVGVAPERVVITGQPRYDSLGAYAGSAASIRARARLGLPKSDFAVMFATQPHQSIEFARKVVRALLAVPSVLVLLRPHPSEPPGKYDGLLGECGSRVRLLREEEIFELVAASNAIVTEYSTVALEGALLGKPAVTVNFDGAAPVVPFVDLKLAVRATSPAELSELISDFASDPSRAGERWGIRAGAAEQLMGTCDGGAGLRVG